MFARIRFSLAAVVVIALGALSACGGAQTKADDGAPCCSGGEGAMTCPVSGAKFTPTDSSPKVEHEGKTYTFCCAGCAAKFKADPAKYAAAASADKPCDGKSCEGKCAGCATGCANCPKCKEGGCASCAECKAGGCTGCSGKACESKDCASCPKCKEGGCASCEDCKKGSCPGCGT